MKRCDNCFEVNSDGATNCVICGEAMEVPQLETDDISMSAAVSPPAAVDAAPVVATYAGQVTEVIEPQEEVSEVEPEVEEEPPAAFEPEAEPEPAAALESEEVAAAESEGESESAAAFESEGVAAAEPEDEPEPAAAFEPEKVVAAEPEDEPEPAAAFESEENAAVEPEDQPEPVAAVEPEQVPAPGPGESNVKPEAASPVPTDIPVNGHAVLQVFHNTESRVVHSHPVVNDVTLIGREDPQRDVFPDLDLGKLAEQGVSVTRVSRQHLRLLRQGEQYFLFVYRGSTGTQVNKDLIDESRYGKRFEIQVGDRIILGGQVRLKLAAGM